MGWHDRLAWASEFPGDQAVALLRLESQSGAGANRTTPADAGPDGTIINWTAASAALNAGNRGNRLLCNANAPSTEQTAARVTYFDGLWPSSGKLLLSIWAGLRYAMTFSPLISSRNTSGKAPLAYLSTMSDGRPRAMVYNAAGTAILDQAETLPWTAAANAWTCYMMLVDLDAGTSQLAMVRHTARDSWVGPVRSLSGTPNPACEANLDAITLTPTAAYWSNGYFDEIVVAHPGPEFNLTDWTERVRLSLYGNARDTANPGLTVTDTGVIATTTATLDTGAEHATWASRPAVHLRTAISGTPLALLSTDDAATWSAPTDPGDLPDTFTGLLRWQVPLENGEVFRGIDLVEAQPVPVLDPVADVELTQHDATTITLTGTWIGTPTITATPDSGIHVTVSGTTLAIATGLAAGDFTIVATVVDDSEQTSAPIIIRVQVSVLPWEPPEPPVFARAPLIVHDADGQRDAVITEATKAVLTVEVNGGQTITFGLPASHPKAAALVAERTIEAVGDIYRIRRLTHYRDGGVPMVECYAEARWYDLRTAGRVRKREWTGAQAGQVLEHVLDGTGWTVGAVNVTTRRTWTMENQTTLAALRAIADVHGGDLVFDNHAKTVSLLTFSGRDRGVAFFHGQALTEAKRVEDTTQLLTRIEPRNEEGVGIEAINGGVGYLEDYSFTSEVKHGVYNFASGTSPQTMLAMTVAAIGKRAVPSVSYEATVADLSAWSGQDIDRFDVGDRVLIADTELGIESWQRIVAMDYDLLQPWASRITLSEKLRELGSDSAGAEAGTLTTGADIDTRDLVPFNLLRNGRFDNGLAHWAAGGAVVVDGGATGTRSVRFGPGTRWIEQTVAADTRDAYTVSMQVDQDGGPTGWVPDLQVVAEVTYHDGTSETITLELS